MKVVFAAPLLLIHALWELIRTCGRSSCFRARKVQVVSSPSRPHAINTEVETIRSSLFEEAGDESALAEELRILKTRSDEEVLKRIKELGWDCVLVRMYDDESTFFHNLAFDGKAGVIRTLLKELPRDILRKALTSPSREGEKELPLHGALRDSQLDIAHMLVGVMEPQDYLIQDHNRENTLHLAIHYAKSQEAVYHITARLLPLVPREVFYQKSIWDRTPGALAQFLGFNALANAIQREMKRRITHLFALGCVAARAPGQPATLLRRFVTNTIHEPRLVGLICSFV